MSVFYIGRLGLIPEHKSAVFFLFNSYTY